MNLVEDGIQLVAPMPRGHAQELLSHLNRCVQYDGHVKQSGKPPRAGATATCWSMDDVVTAPHLLEFGLSLTSVVANYLKQIPLMYSVNAFTTYPVSGPLNADIQEYHRDKDDALFLALFVYLTDVLNVYDGPHQFLRGTHTTPNVGGECRMYGPAGTAFLADTRALHRGLRPQVAPRTIAWVRWGVSDPPASYVWDKLSPVPAQRLGERYPQSMILQESLKLVVR